LIRTFVDTSAFYALIVANDPGHARAKRVLTLLLDGRDQLVATSFVVHETVTLLQARLGMQPVRLFAERFLPHIEVVAVEGQLLSRSLEALLAAARRHVSFTDWTSFIVMREYRIRRAFAFDPHFAEQGFEVLSGS
jgi:uncharacterized protein